MAFLKILGKIIEYKDAKEATKIIKDHAILYVLNWKILVDLLKHKIQENSEDEVIEIDKKFLNQIQIDEINDLEYFKKDNNDKVEEVVNSNKNDEKINVSVPPKEFETKFGYEFEVMKVKFDDENQKVSLDLSGEIDIRHHKELEEKDIDNKIEFAYQPEYAKYMVEGKFPFLFYL